MQLERIFLEALKICEELQKYQTNVYIWKKKRKIKIRKSYELFIYAVKPVSPSQHSIYPSITILNPILFHFDRTKLTKDKDNKNQKPKEGNSTWHKVAKKREKRKILNRGCIVDWPRLGATRMKQFAFFSLWKPAFDLSLPFCCYFVPFIFSRSAQ